MRIWNKNMSTSSHSLPILTNTNHFSANQCFVKMYTCKHIVSQTAADSWLPSSRSLTNLGRISMQYASHIVSLKLIESEAGCRTCTSNKKHYNSEDNQKYKMARIEKNMCTKQEVSITQWILSFGNLNFYVNMLIYIILCRFSSQSSDILWVWIAKIELPFYHII